MQINLPNKFQPLFEPHRYKSFYGGRGSAKSHSFATALVVLAASKPLRVLCAREIQKSIKDSVKRLIDDKIKQLGLSDFYESTDTEIRGKNGSLFLFAGIKSNPENIKSMEGVDICWIEEANTISQKSLDILIPTIRKEKSELWFSWNPQNEEDPIDMMFRGKNPPPDSVIQSVSWIDNPWFPDVLKKEMEFDKGKDYEKYLHVWRGHYQKQLEGAYFAKEINQAIEDGRIATVPYDSASGVYVSWDLGISDLTSLWFAQFIGKEVHIIDFYESNGQPVNHFVKYIKEKPYIYEIMILPHDARSKQLGTGKSIEEQLRNYGFKTMICPKISVKDGIDAARNFINKCWFDIRKCESGIKSLKKYKENFDEKLRVSRGPLHDEHSHAADSFRYLAVATGLTHNNKKENTADVQKSIENLIRFGSGTKNDIIGVQKQYTDTL